MEEHDQAAPEGRLQGVVRADQVTVRNGVAAAIVGSNNAEVAGGGALVIAAGNTMQVNGGGAGALMAGNTLEIHGGGGWVLLAGNSIPIQNGGGAVLVAGRAEVKHGVVGVLLAGHTTLGEGARVLLSTPQALALGAACGLVFALVGRGRRARAR
jgi:hypothetical protein